MSRRRRRVMIKSSSRLFAFILFNLLLLASCTTAHYLHEQPQSLGSQQLADLNQDGGLNQQQHQHQHQKQAQSSQSATQGISMTTLAGSSNKHQLQARVASTILSTSQPFSLVESHQEASSQAAQQQQASGSSSSSSSSVEDQEEAGETEEAQQEQVVAAHLHRPPGSSAHEAPHSGHQQQQHAGGVLPSISNLCSQLPSARHLKLCKLIGHSPNADETVALGAARGLAECRNQFKSERWNCTHSSGDHHLLTGRLAQSVGYRESAFVQAIAAAGIVHSIATACSIGSMSDCACDKTRMGLIRQKDKIWKWGGCSNNVRHGMMFAKHLVELLDAVHEHSRQQQQLAAHHQHHLVKRQLTRRSLSSRHRERDSNQLETSAPVAPLALLATPAELLQQQQQLLNFCQKNQNISQSTQVQLIKSLLAKNSLERHQDFRLAVNMHNNRVGRMAVAKNMEIKCRCHGLSGSCSLKTCWLRLPDFQQIGAYLKRKYDGSIHLPSAINLNRLIPMMDKQEISAILLQNNQEQEHQAITQSNQVAPPEFAALTSGGPTVGIEKTANSNLTAPLPAPSIVPAPAANASLHFSYYERHKQQLERLASAAAAAVAASPARTALSSPLSAPSGYNNQTSLLLHGDETPIPIVPMSQQQYQSLLRDMKLCNSNSSAASKTPTVAPPHQLRKRHLLGARLERQPLTQQHQQHSQYHHHHHLNQHQKLQHIATKRLHHQTLPAAGGARQQQSRHPPIGQLLGSQNRDDLVHLHKSPDYCEAEHGFGGVQARACSPDPLASNSCDKLCCGRGHERRETHIRYKCDCKFQYCCTIHCNYCHKELVEFVCR